MLTAKIFSCTKTDTGLIYEETLIAGAYVKRQGDHVLIGKVYSVPTPEHQRGYHTYCLKNFSHIHVMNAVGKTIDKIWGRQDPQKRNLPDDSFGSDQVRVKS